MNKIYRVLLVSALLMGFVVSQAQEVSPVDFMRMNPYQMKANPAADLPYKSVMSLVVGNIGLNVQNTTLRFDNLFDFDAQGRPKVYNLRKLANSLKDDNFLCINANIDLFTFYHRLNKGMLTFDYGIKVQNEAKYNDGLFKLIGYGNSAFLGESNPASVNMSFDVAAYQEFALGYQLNITERFSLGGRAKLLFGLANVNSRNVDVKLFTDPDTYALRLEEDIAIRASMPGIITINDGAFATNGSFGFGDLFHNPGFGIDLAAEYRFNERFSAVAAVRDLGFISWGANNFEMNGSINDAGQFYDNGGFLFNGMDIDQLQLVISDESYRELFLDTLKQYFHVSVDKGEKYTTMLNTNLMLRGNYDIDSHNRFSIQAQGRYYHSGFRPALTLAYNGSFIKMFDICATYTVMQGSYDNIGLGLAGNFGVFHVYLTTSNVVGFFKPFNTSMMNAQVGIVFNLRSEEKNIEYK